MTTMVLTAFCLLLPEMNLSRVRLRRLLHPCGFQLVQDVGDVVVVLGEDVLGEADDGLGDTRRVGQAHAVAQDLQQRSPERCGQEGVRARLPVALVGGGDGDEDARGDVQEQPAQLRAGVVGDHADGVDVPGLQRTAVGEGVGDAVGIDRGERRGDGVLAYDSSSRSGRPC
ncbi:hypothetical protein [Streptomyces sp. NPDC018347]|uniref:hypothetical protein n=1 Tax=Streptomyces sp. NPDC018347 TaxID=3157193 RepID=UPI0033C84986